MILRISIALALYNGEKYLQQLLDSLLAQEFQPYEIVALDDCSEDASAIIFNNFKFEDVKLRYYKNNKNIGPIGTFKRLISLCEGEFIAFCDQDDVWMPNKLKLSIIEMQKLNNKVPCVVFTDLTVIDNKNDILYQSEFKKWNIKIEKYRLLNVFFRNIIVGCTALINKEMAIELKKMPLNVIMHDHWIALIAYGFGGYKIVNQPTVYFRSHLSSVTKKEKNSVLFKILNSIKLGRSYLTESFDQVRLYEHLYFNKLDIKRQADIKTFLNLENKFFFAKRLYAYIKKYPK